MKRYLVFGYDSTLAYGGWNDLLFTTDDLTEITNKITINPSIGNYDYQTEDNYFSPYDFIDIVDLESEAKIQVTFREVPHV